MGKDSEKCHLNYLLLECSRDSAIINPIQTASSVFGSAMEFNVKKMNSICVALMTTNSIPTIYLIEISK